MNVLFYAQSITSSWETVNFKIKCLQALQLHVFNAFIMLTLIYLMWAVSPAVSSYPRFLPLGYTPPRVNIFYMSELSNKERAAFKMIRLSIVIKCKAMEHSAEAGTYCSPYCVKSLWDRRCQWDCFFAPIQPTFNAFSYHRHTCQNIPNVSFTLTSDQQWRWKLAVALAGWMNELL